MHCPWRWQAALLSDQQLTRGVSWGPAWADSGAWGGTWPRHIPWAGPEARTAVPASALIFGSFWLRSLKPEPTFEKSRGLVTGLAAGGLRPILADRGGGGGDTGLFSTLSLLFRQRGD